MEGRAWVLDLRLPCFRLPRIVAALSLVSILCPACSESRPADSHEPADAASISTARARYKEFFDAHRQESPIGILPRVALYGGPDTFGLLTRLAVVDHRIIAIVQNDSKRMGIRNACAQTGTCKASMGDICFVNGEQFDDRRWIGAASIGVRGTAGLVR